ncbi:MAG: sulfur carrier protein ThiS [Proteobacteria bacterium]|nr:MAG: sulfur carrier protein ThiS [Pseudomonadota bacterium]QKK10384.1 MAG: sulfur carrier protein ThiS [Pseudomonadota bacterium]
MKITLNGEPREVADQSTAQQLIELLGLADKRLAMEINREIVPRSSYATHALQEGDTIEIVRAIGGG